MLVTAQTGEENRMSLPKAESEIGMTKMQSVNGVKEFVEGKKHAPYRLELFIKVYRQLGRIFGCSRPSSSIGVTSGTDTETKSVHQAHHHRQ